MRHAFIPLLICLACTPWAHAQIDDMQPIRGFAIDRTEVSIAQFARYVQATGTVTTAEKAGGGSTYEGGWVQRPGWSWRTPFGLKADDREPAVHLTFAEARAYCQWAGKRLPNDAEWMEAAYTERRANPPAGFTTGQTYPYPTGTSPQGANCLGECGAAPTLPAYASPAITTRGRGHVPAGTYVPLEDFALPGPPDRRRHRQRPPHARRLLVVWRGADAPRACADQTGGHGGGVHRVSLREKPAMSGRAQPKA